MSGSHNDCAEDRAARCAAECGGRVGRIVVMAPDAKHRRLAAGSSDASPASSCSTAPTVDGARTRSRSTTTAARTHASPSLALSASRCHVVGTPNNRDDGRAPSRLPGGVARPRDRATRSGACRQLHRASGYGRRTPPSASGPSGGALPRRTPMAIGALSALREAGLRVPQDAPSAVRRHPDGA